MHCHVDLYPDFNKVVTQADKNGVAAIIAVSMDLESMGTITKISNHYSGFVFPSLGLHPDACSRTSEINLTKAVKLIKNNAKNLVAIGEIGLDHHFVKIKELYPWQQRIFREMLRTSQDLNLPVILHTKGAERLIFKILDDYKPRDVLIHWYTGPKDLIDIGIKKGYYFSITPAVTYSKNVQYLVKKVGVDYLMTESDGPVEYNRIRGEPKDCKIIVKKIAEIKGYSEGKVEEVLFENAVSFFKLDLNI